MSCLCRELRRENDVILDKQVTKRRRVLEMRHALALDGLHESGLSDALTLERDDTPIQMSQIPREAK